MHFKLLYHLIESVKTCTLTTKSGAPPLVHLWILGSSILRRHGRRLNHVFSTSFPPSDTPLRLLMTPWGYLRNLLPPSRLLLSLMWAFLDYFQTKSLRFGDHDARDAVHDVDDVPEVVPGDVTDVPARCW